MSAVLTCLGMTIMNLSLLPGGLTAVYASGDSVVELYLLLVVTVEVPVEMIVRSKV